MFSEPTIAAWILRHLARLPFTWAWVAATLALWPATQAFSPLGLTTATTSTYLNAPLYEFAFLSLLVGTTLGVRTLGTAGWILERASSARRMRAEATAIALAGAAFLLVSLLGPLALSSTDISTWLRLAAATALSLLHLVMLGLLIRRLPVPRLVQCWLVPGLAWILPSLVHGTSLAQVGLSGYLEHLLDASRHLQVAGPIQALDTKPFFPAALVEGLHPIMTLAAVAMLIQVRPGACRR